MSIQEELDALPLGMFLAANRYDTEDTHVLHLWTKEGLSYDVMWPRELCATTAFPGEPFDGESGACMNPADLSGPFPDMCTEHNVVFAS